MPGLKEQLVIESGVSEGWEQGARASVEDASWRKNKILSPVFFIHAIF